MTPTTNHHPPRARRTAADTRERILDAAAQVLGTLGLAKTTTKQIARTAGYSEATLYKHFNDKTDLLMAVLGERLPPLIALLTHLPDQAGHGEVAEHLEQVADQAIRFYQHSFPILASLFAEPALLARHRQALAAVGAGPQRANQALAAYLHAERELGRIDAGVDPDAAAAMLLGACFQRAFLSAFSGQPIPDPEPTRLAASLATCLLAGRTEPNSQPSETSTRIPPSG